MPKAEVFCGGPEHTTAIDKRNKLYHNETLPIENIRRGLWESDYKGEKHPKSFRSSYQRLLGFHSPF